MTNGEKNTEKDARKADLSSECDHSGNKTVTGNYGFLYVSESLISRLQKYIEEKDLGVEWSSVGSISLVVKQDRQFFQVSDASFRRLVLIPLAEVLKP